MFQLLKDPSFDFMRRGRLLLGLSAAVVLASVVVLVTHGLNLGIEFTGGTELQIKYAEPPDIAAIRGALGDAGLTSQVTTIGAPEEHEIYIRLADGEGPGKDKVKDVTGLVASTLRAGSIQPDRVDLNVVDQATLRDLLVQSSTLGAGDAADLAEAVLEQRKDVAVFHSLDEVAALPGVTAEVQALFERQAYTGPLSVRSQSFIFPAVGEELMDKAQLAIVLSLVMMLLYIWIRFQLQWGFAAVVALTHDTLITLGLFSLFGKEMSLPVVAAFLTLVGYSVNDTVVVFDRIRENLKNRSAPTFKETINLSINQTLGRTIITSGLTWIVVFGLYLYGGAALNAFAFVLSVGVIVGTYSSIYIASPLLLLWGRAVPGRAAAAESAASPAAGARRVKKVRTTSS